LFRRAAGCLTATFIEGDLADWTPAEPVDPVFANAAYQWVPNHLEALSKVLQTLTAGSVLAVQMPDNTREPSHLAMDLVARRFGAPEAARADLPDAATYYDRLKPLCAHLEIWRTIYNHALAGPAAIAEWFRGSALRPFLAGMQPEQAQQFLSAYIDEIRPHYPERADGSVLLRFPRLFIVATR
jgi:trans-aconitate 2-methyltransferase